MTQKTELKHSHQEAVKMIRLADELDDLQRRITISRMSREADSPEKQRVVTARRVIVHTS